MTNDKTPEQAAEEYAEWFILQQREKNPDAEAERINALKVTIRYAYKVGDTNGYSRGKADAEKRIWEELEKHSVRNGGWIEEKLSDLKQIIFGGWDDGK